MPFRILLATDLGEGSRHAAVVARHLAPADAEMRVVHIVPWSPLDAATHGGRGSTRPLDAAEAEARAWAAAAGVQPTDVGVKRGDVGHVLADEAKASDAEMVALGSHEDNALERALLGSVARDAVRRIHGREVLVARPRGAWPPRRILVATDFGEPAKWAARRARAIADRHGASLVLVHVVDPAAWQVAAEPAGGPAGAFLAGSADRLVAEEGARELAGRAEAVLLHGRPAVEVAQAARERDVDLVVVGSHGAGAIERVLLGSVAVAVVERAPVSVLVVGAP